MSSRRIGKAAIVIALVPLLWVATAVTMTFALGRSNPKAALAWWPWAAEPKALLAERALERDPMNGDPTRLVGQLQAAMAREPINVRAARTLGLVRSFTDPVGATRIFDFAARLSRRDLPTELWLIESAVQRGDVKGALVHYDHALRTSRGANDVLLPTLVAASADPAVARELEPFLRARPNWWRPFLLLAIEQGRNSAALAYLVAAFGPDLSKPQEYEIARLAIARVADLGPPETAGRLYARLTTGRASGLTTLHNGGFETGGDFVPLDWAFVDTTDLSATPERFGAGDTRLELRVANDARGKVARQMLVVAPGRYTLSGMMGSEGDAGNTIAPTITIICIRSDRTILSEELRLGKAAKARFGFDLSIPAGCGGQWLTLALDGTGTAWIDDLSLTRSTADAGRQ